MRTALLMMSLMDTDTMSGVARRGGACVPGRSLERSESAKAGRRPRAPASGAPTSRIQRWLAVLFLAVLSLAGGCATKSGPGNRMARYQPDMSHRDVWNWSKANERAPAVTPAPVAPAATNATPAPVAPAATNAAVAPVTTPTPSSTNSNPTSRVLKRGDKIVIYLRDIPKIEEIKVDVDGNGNVNLPLIGLVRLAGLTTAEAQELIQKLYVDGRYYVKISVIVTAEEDEYYVQGEVLRAGRFPLTHDVTLLQAIATAGGYNDFAKKSKIKIIRGKDVSVHDADRIEKGKDKDPLIRPGDVIMVPRRWIF